MALHASLEISLAGNLITAFKSLSISQSLASHHQMDLVCRMDVLEKIEDELATASRNYIGETIIVRITSNDALSNYSELRFKGLVTSVNMTKGFHRQEGDLVNLKIQGCSILADDGAHFTSFSEVDIATILQNTYSGYDMGKLETNFNPSSTETILYSVCSNESAFEYTKRLSAQYGEWFYYDGQALIFGLPEDPEPIELSYGINLMDFTLDLQPLPNSFKYMTNNYLSNEYHELATKDVSSNVNGYNGFASTKSDELFGKESTVFLHGYEDAGAKQRLDTQVQKQKEATENKQISVRGSSDNPGIQLGSIIKIKGETEHYGSFRITKVKHSASEGGRYSNTFEGVSADISAYPLTDISAFPKSGSQVAIVKDNNDPEKLGRIKCQFPWQIATGETTPWIRMVVPHAGAGKGFHYLPEKSEEILVGFENNSAERPYIIGSLYNGNANPSEWHTDDNNLKYQSTRSGHTMIFDDTEGKEELTIYDKDQNSIITFESHTQSLKIHATENLDITAKNINISAEENINIQAKGTIESAAEGDVKILAQGTIATQSDSDTTIKSKAALALEATSDLTAKGMNAVIEGKTGAELNGAQTKVTGKALTEVSAGIVKIN